MHPHREVTLLVGVAGVAVRASIPRMARDLAVHPDMATPPTDPWDICLTDGLLQSLGMQPRDAADAKTVPLTLCRLLWLQMWWWIVTRSGGYRELPTAGSPLPESDTEVAKLDRYGIHHDDLFLTLPDLGVSIDEIRSQSFTDMTDWIATWPAHDRVRRLNEECYAHVDRMVNCCTGHTERCFPGSVWPDATITAGTYRTHWSSGCGRI